MPEKGKKPAAEPKKKAAPKAEAAKPAAAKKAAAKPAAKQPEREAVAAPTPSAPRPVAQAAAPKPKPKPAPPAPKRIPEKALKVTQIHSQAGRFDDQHATLKGLGLGKISRSRVLEDTPAVRGMIERVKHLVRIDPVA